MTPLELNATSLLADANLKAYYRFEDNWNDTDGSGYNLTPANSPTFVTGKFGKAGHFVGASSQYAYRALASMAAVNITTSQSYMMWLKIPTFADNMYFCGNSNGGHWFMYGNSAGTIIWATPLSANNSVALPNTTDFHHVAFSYNSVTAKISSWLNGVCMQNNIDATGTFTKSGVTNWAIGRAGDYTGGYFTGDMDDFAFFDRAITQTDIDKIFPPAKVGSPMFFGGFSIA